jgi:tetratricopeptide (TPR) repeat protein
MGEIMRRILIGMALMLVTLPASAQVSTEEWNQCWVAGTTIPADKRIDYCTQLIESGGVPTANMAALYSNRAIAYSDSGLYDQAIADYNKAISLDPKNARYFFDRGEAYRKSRLYDKAIADYSHAIALNPNYDSAYNNRASVYDTKGDGAKGLPDADKAIALAPTANHFGTRALIYEKLGQRDKAIADYRAALKLDPNHKSAQDGLNRLGVAPQ